MSYIYILSLIFLGVSFLLLKKSDEKISFIKWLLIFLCAIYPYNITVCMILGIIQLKQNIWLLALINIIFGLVMLIKTIKSKEKQKYTVNKKEVIITVVMLVLFTVMFIKDLYIYKGDVTHFIVDPAIHYRAAKHYSENLNLFVFLENKTFFNFNIMQTGAYINDGIFMNVMHSITGVDYIYLFQAFETMSLFLCGISLMIFILDRLDTIKGLIGSSILLALYMYGYPYNSWIYGFSYLTVGIILCTYLIPIVEMLFSKENISKKVIIPLIIITGMGIIFSYCLFVPAVFSAVCIYIFIKEFNDKASKKYLKFFGKYTLIVTGLLLLVTIFGICYLFIPSFFIEGQTNLVSALQENGGIYSEKYKNFIAYIPFIIMFLFNFVKRFKEKTLRFMDVFSIISFAYIVLLYGGMLLKVVSPYYMLKFYFIIWMVIFMITIDIINDTINDKIFRLDAFAFFALYLFLVFAKVSIEDGLKIGLVLILTLFTVLPDKFKEKINFDKFKITANTYVCLWGIFVAVWVLLKAGNVLPEEQKHSLPNLVGMYYSEDCEYRKALDLNSSFSKNNIEIIKDAKDNISDLTADNTAIITDSSYRTMWAMATLEYNSDKIEFKDVVNDTNQWNLDKILKDENIKYIIRIDSNDQNKIDECKEQIEEINEEGLIQILYSNENGYVAKVNNR